MGWRNSWQKAAVLKAVNMYPSIIIFDTETTGLDPSKGNEIIELAAKKCVVNPQNTLVEVDRLHLYIKPLAAVSEKIEELTGISNEFLADKPSLEEVFPQIKAFFDGEIIAAYNTPFDKKFMEASYKRCGHEFSPEHEVDVLIMARDLVPKSEVENHKLRIIASYYGVDEGIRFHSAIDDVEATRRLFEVFIDQYMNEPEPKGNLVPTIERVSFWEGFRGFSRIYVETSNGTIYYDIRSKCWETKNAPIELFDMETVEKRILEITRHNTLDEFAHFRGSIRTGLTM